MVREKQIKVETATAHHVFSGEDATVSNSSPLDSNEELIVLSPEIVKSTEVTTQSERAKVDPQSSDCPYQKGNIDTSIRSMDMQREFSENGTIPTRLVNPSAQPVKVFRETRLGDFSSVGDEVDTFEFTEFFVKSFPTPASLQSLKSFLGLANYYRRFIKGFSEIASPLNALTKKGVKFFWSESCANAFDRLKRALISPPVLVFPDFEEQFLLYVDLVQPV